MKASIITDNALLTVSSETLRLNISTELLPLNIDQMEPRNMPNVLVFIPPPVDPGEAPININIIIRK